MTLSPSPPRQRRRVGPRTVTALLLTAVLITWAVVNREQVVVDLVVDERRMPLWVALAAAAVLGALVGLVVGRRRYRR